MPYIGEKPKQGGAPGNQFVQEHDNTVKGDYTMESGRHGVSAGPITIENGVTVTIETNARWVIV